VREKNAQQVTTANARIGPAILHGAGPLGRAFSSRRTGRAPVRGGLLVARLGRGSYVYTGLSFFRALPAGVPGVPSASA